MMMYIGTLDICDQICQRGLISDISFVTIQ